MSDFTNAIVAVMQDKDTMQKYEPLGGIAPVEILQEVWFKYPGEFQFCTVIDVTHERDAVYALLTTT